MNSKRHPAPNSRAHASHRAQDIVFSRSAPEKPWPTLREGQTITYELMLDADGEWYAVNIEIVAEPSLN